jgi:hypothetical protein
MAENLATLIREAKEALGNKHFGVGTLLQSKETGQPQPPTTTETGNNVAVGIANNSGEQERSKAVDMRFFWMRDRARQGQFHIAWCKGAFNKADCFSKHRSTAHHRDLQSTHLCEPPSCNSNCFDCPQDDEDDGGINNSNDNASPGLHRFPCGAHSAHAHSASSQTCSTQPARLN